MLNLKLIKKEKESEIMAKALKKANSRLGVEIVSDTGESDTSPDSDANTEVHVNTRHYQTDAEFAKNYFFITNVIITHYHAPKYFSYLFIGFLFVVKWCSLLFRWCHKTAAENSE